MFIGVDKFDLKIFNENPLFKLIVRASKLSLRRLFLLLAAIGVIRTGLGFYGSGMLEVSENLPKPTATYQSFNLPGPILAKILGVNTTHEWIFLHLLVLPLFVYIVGRLLLKKVEGTAERQFVIIALGCSSMPSVLVSQIGHYDTYLFLWSSIIALTTGYTSALIVGLFFGITHFEQSVFMLIALGFLSLALRSRQIPRLVLALFASAVMRIGLAVWVDVYDINTPTRWNLLTSRVGVVVHMNLRLIFVHIFSFYGAAWFFVLSFILISPKKIRLYLILSMITIPFFGFLFAFDGTRIFSNLSWAVLITVCVWITRDKEVFGRIKETSPITLLFFFLTPGIITHVGEVQVVYSDIVRKTLEILRII